MEMEYHHEGRRRKVLLVPGVVLAVAAGGAAFFLVNQAQNAGTGVVATRDVVVAARDIPARTVIQSSDLTIRAVPDDPSLAVAIASPEDAIGRITGVAILFQQPITPNLLASTDKSTKIPYQDLSILARNGTLYILRVDIAQAEEISHLQAAGNAQFSLVLRPDGDDRQVDTEKLGETTNRIIEKYGLPIPEIYPAP